MDIANIADHSDAQRHHEDPIGALKALLQAPGLEPELIALSMAERSAHRDAEAAEDDPTGERQARDAIRRAPDDPMAHYELARVLMRSQHWHAAAQHYRQAIDLSGPPRDPVLLSALAFCLKTAGQLARLMHGGLAVSGFRLSGHVCSLR